MRCPRCGIELAQEQYEGDVVIDRCPGCRGTWADKGELERIQELRDRDHSAELARGPDHVKAAFGVARQRNLPPVACPVCGTPMERREHGMASQVLVDGCPRGHGLWLDSGELEALEVFFERTRAEVESDARGGPGVFHTLWHAWKR